VGTFSAQLGILVLTLLPSFYFLSFPFCLVVDIRLCLVVDIRLCFCWLSTLRWNLGCYWANKWLWSPFCFVFFLCVLFCVSCVCHFVFFVFVCFCGFYDSLAPNKDIVRFRYGDKVTYPFGIIFSENISILLWFFLLTLGKHRTILISLNPLSFDY